MKNYSVFLICIILFCLQTHSQAQQVDSRAINFSEMLGFHQSSFENFSDRFSPFYKHQKNNMFSIEIPIYGHGDTSAFYSDITSGDQRKILDRAEKSYQEEITASTGLQLQLRTGIGDFALGSVYNLWTSVSPETEDFDLPEGRVFFLQDRFIKWGTWFHPLEDIKINLTTQLGQKKLLRQKLDYFDLRNLRGKNILDTGEESTYLHLHIHAYYENQIGLSSLEIRGLNLYSDTLNFSSDFTEDQELAYSQKKIFPAFLRLAHQSPDLVALLNEKSSWEMKAHILLMGSVENKLTQSDFHASEFNWSDSFSRYARAGFIFSQDHLLFDSTLSARGEIFLMAQVSFSQATFQVFYQQQKGDFELYSKKDKADLMGLNGVIFW
jgi:hypothetical protein